MYLRAEGGFKVNIQFKGQTVDTKEWVEGVGLLKGVKTYIITKEQMNYAIISTDYHASLEVIEVLPETVTCVQVEELRKKWEGRIEKYKVDLKSVSGFESKELYNTSIDEVETCLTELKEKFK